MKTPVSKSQRQFGKTAAQEKSLAEFLTKNPDATVVRITPDGFKIEKVVKEVPLYLPLRSNK